MVEPIIIKNFTVSFIAMTPSSPIARLRLQATLEVTGTVNVTRYREWCDGTIVEDFVPPTPPTEGTSVFDQERQATIGFSLLAHNYKIRFEYANGYAEATAKFFTPTEILVLAGIAIAVPSLILIGYFYLKKR